MNFLSYLRVELRRVFLSPSTRLVMVLSLIVPLIGFWLYKPTDQFGVTLTGQWLGNPVLAGSIGGVVLFTLLTLFELDKIHKNGTDRLTDTIVSPVIMCLTRVLSLLAAATATGLLASVIYLPYTLYKVGYLFDWGTYWGLWLVIFLPALWMGSLLAAVFYQITRRTDFSLLLVIVLIIPCFSDAMYYEFMLRWINPDVPFLSDMFGNTLIIRIMIRSRGFQMVTLLGLYILSLSCVRKYGKNLLGSFLHNSRRIYGPVLGTVALVLAVYLYTGQPFVSRSAPGLNEEVFYRVSGTMGSDQALANRDARMYTFIKPDLGKGTLEGYTTWKFPNSTDKPIYMQINRGLKITSLTVNGEPVEFEYVDENIMDYKFVVFDVSHIDEKLEITAEYGGLPVVWRNNEKSGYLTSVISPQYFRIHALYNEDVGLPPNLWAGYTIVTNPEPVTSILEIVLPDNLVLLDNYIEGQLSQRLIKPQMVAENGDGTTTWRIGSASLNSVEIFAADYLYENIKMGDGNGINFYYARKNQRIMEKYNALETLKDIYDFCSRKIAAQAPRSMVYVQTPGPKEMEFSEHALANQWRPVSGQDTLAYQMILNWWSEMKFLPYREMWEGEDFVSIESTVIENVYMLRPREWSIQGITEYIAYRFAADMFGEEYAYATYVEFWKQKARDYYNNFYVRNPEYMELLSTRHTNRIAQMQQELRYLYTMPLKIWKAAELIGGQDKMMELLARLYKNSYTEAANPAMRKTPVIEMTYEEFWEFAIAQFIENDREPPTRKPGTVMDGYLEWMNALYSGHVERPPTKQEFKQLVNLDEIFAACGISLENKDWEAAIMSHWYEVILEWYDAPGQPYFYYEDLLAACGLTDDQLKLTAKDW